MPQLALKDNLREGQLFSNRAVVAVVLISLGMLALVGRMAQLQITSHEHYDTLSQNNRVSIVPVPPTRGLIFDRDGVILAQNLPTYSLELVPERIKDLDRTIADIRELIDVSDDEVARFKRRIKQQRRFQSTPLRFRLNDEEAARIAVNRHRLPGVEVEARLTRDYPQANLAVHAIGYVGRINERELGLIL